jgi:hypothetical protein
MIDTTSSFVAGYAVAAILIVAYVVTLGIRARRLAAKLRRYESGTGRAG